MSTVNVTVTPVAPIGTAIPLRRIRTRLVAGGYGAPGHGTGGEILSESFVDLGVSTSATLVLQRNSEITPAGTFYEVSIPSLTGAKWWIQLAAGTASTVQVGDPSIQVQSPVGPGVAAGLAFVGPPGPPGPSGGFGALRRFNVLDYGATGNGTADDTAAIQATIVAAETAGGGVVYLPRGTYLVNTFVTPGTNQYQTYALLVKGNNIWIRGDGDSTVIKSTSDQSTTAAQIFSVLGTARVSGVANHFTNWACYVAGQQIAPAAKGDTVLTGIGSTTAFNIDDWVYVKAGQLLSGFAVEQPDAELNQVVAKTSSTLTLRYPLSKPYRTEYRAGSTGPTTTTVAANTVQPQVVPVNDRIGHNFRLTDMRFDTPNVGGWCFALHYTDITMDRLSGTFGTSGGCQVQTCRFTRIANISASRRSVTASGENIVIPAGVATGTNDTLIENVTVDGNSPSSIHVHEGAASTTIRNVRMLVPLDATSPQISISIAARQYDTSIDSCVLIGSANNAPIIVQNECVGGGSISNCVIVTGASSSINLLGGNWTARDNRVNKPIYRVGETGPNAAWGNTGTTLVTGTNTTRSGFDIAAPLTLGEPTQLPSGATPSVAAVRGEMVYTSGTETAHNITNLLGGQDQQLVTIVFNDANLTLVDYSVGGSFLLAGATNWTPPTYSTITLLHVGGQWWEVGRNSRVPAFSVQRRSAKWVNVTQFSGYASTGALSANLWAYTPVILAEPLPVSALAMNVGTAATTGTALARMMLFANDATYNIPAARSQDLGTVDVTTTGTKTWTPSGGTVLPAGLSWVCWGWQGTATGAPVIQTNVGSHPVIGSNAADALGAVAAGYYEANASVPTTAGALNDWYGVTTAAQRT